MKHLYIFLFILFQLSYNCSAQLTTCGVNPCAVNTNLIANGDFEAGNTGFTTALNTSCVCGANSYCVTTTPNPGKCANGLWQNIPAPSGNLFMVIDGQQNVSFWANTITGLTIGTTYYYSFLYHPNISGGGTPNINLLINGVSVGNTTGTSGAWSEHCFPWVANSTTANLDFRQTNHPQYSDYAIDRVFFGDCFTILENKILNFEGKSISNQEIQINWELESLESTEEIQLEYSIDGISFELINSFAPSTKNYIHQTIQKDNYYRLKTIGINDEITISNVIHVSQSNLSSAIKIYPIPAQEYINIECQFEDNSNEVITVFDPLGRNINLPITQQFNSWKIDTKKLAPGLYYISIKTPKAVITRRFQVTK